ncbi:MAG: hypothetical protein ACOYB4_05390 [Methyloceanibacter sp.]
MTSASRWLALVGLMLMVAIVAVSLVPSDWSIRLGLHWLVEHFLIFFIVTLLLSFAWGRPMVVAAVLLPISPLLETLQRLTPDRQADLATAISGMVGVAAAALLADLVITLRKRRKNN